MTVLKAFSLMPSMGLKKLPAAPQMTKSIRPNFLTVSSTAALSDSTFLTSAVKPRHCLPVDFDNSSAADRMLASRRPMMVALQPTLMDKDTKVGLTLAGKIPRMVQERKPSGTGDHSRSIKVLVMPLQIPLPPPVCASFRR